MVGTSAPTLCRLVKLYGHLADHELIPEKVAPSKSGGVNCEWGFLLKRDEVKRKLLELYIACMVAANATAANDVRTAQVAPALFNFSYAPDCPAKLAERLRDGYQPVDFVRYLRSAITPEVEARIRGAKHSQLYGASGRRDYTFRLPDGRRGEEPAAACYCADDMSENHPFYVAYDGGEVLSRQGLYFIESKHKCWQSVELVARVRESYTAADILRAFYGLCQAQGGIPHCLTLEQGIWKSRLVAGFTLDGGWLVEETTERPAMDAAQKDLIVKGLELCGVKLMFKYSAHLKPIEANFNPLQTNIACVATGFQHIGRYAGEYEYPGKQLRRVRAASHKAADLGFASQAQLADCIWEAMRRTNDKPSAVDGLTRAQAHEADLQRQPLLPLTDRLFAACLPGEPRKTTLRNGCINVELRGKQYQFRDGEKFAALGDGYELFYKIDETNPNLGCAVFNRTPQTNRANYQGWQPGDFMFNAPREIPGPMRDLITAPAGVDLQTVEQIYGEGAIDRGDTELKKAKKFVATQARHLPRPGQISIRTSTARDGRGNVVATTNVEATTSGPAAAVGRQSVASAPAESLPPRASTAKPADLPYSLRKLLQEQECEV